MSPWLCDITCLSLEKGQGTSDGEGQLWAFSSEGQHRAPSWDSKGRAEEEEEEEGTEAAQG